MVSEDLTLIQNINYLYKIFQHPDNKENRQLPKIPQYEKLLNPSPVTRGNTGTPCQCTNCRIGRTTLIQDKKEILEKTDFNTNVHRKQ